MDNSINKKTIIYPPVYIAGPTASGKSALAVKLARKIDSVIISADSMQIYRGLDIGTAKESEKIRNEIPHKLIDVVDADEEFSVAEFAQMAKTEIENAQNCGKLPIVVGGTGLYFESLLYPMSFANYKISTEACEYLSTVFLYNFERPAVYNIVERQQYARAWYDFITQLPASKGIPIWLLFKFNGGG